MPLEWQKLDQAYVASVYADLREIAHRLLSRERSDHTLQRTALVHEALIRLAGIDPSMGTPEILAAAANQMRHILVDHARKRLAKKRGGEFSRVPLLESDSATDRDEDTLLALDEALERLGEVDGRALSVVELKFFGGCTNAETAEILNISDGTVEADWQFARSWLFGILTEKPRSLGRN